MSSFQVVPDSLRTQFKSGRQRNEETEAVLAGKTIFLPTNGKAPTQVASSWHSRIGTASNRKKRAVTRKYRLEGVEGVLVWAEDREETA